MLGSGVFASSTALERLKQATDAWGRIPMNAVRALDRFSWKAFAACSFASMTTSRGMSAQCSAFSCGYYVTFVSRRPN
jgi:hypothetical protein